MSERGAERPRPLLTVAQAADLLGIARTKAYDLAREGTLPGLVRQPGHHYVVRRTALESWLAGEPPARKELREVVVMQQSGSRYVHVDEAGVVLDTAAGAVPAGGVTREQAAKTRRPATPSEDAAPRLPALDRDTAPVDVIAAHEMARTVGATKVEVRRVAADRLVIDPIRAIRIWWVKKLVRMPFDVGATGALHVSRRSDGRLVVIEGNHRVLAAREAGQGAAVLTCFIYSGLTVAQEAALYRALETKLSQAPLDLFMGRCQEGEPIACDMRERAGALGIAIGHTSGGGTPRLGAVKRAEAIYRRYGAQAYSRVLRIAQASWRDQRTAFDGYVLGGLARFLDMFGADVDEGVLVRRLAGLTTAQVRQRGKGAAEALGLTSAYGWDEGTGRAIYAIYNRNLRAAALPKWRERTAGEDGADEAGDDR